MLPLQDKKRFSPDYYLRDDETFNTLFPPSMRLLASRHWTPLRITQKALAFFKPRKDSKILDIGSGIGKFCLAAAAQAPEAHVYGVEQRPPLIDHAVAAMDKLGLKNVSFIEGNFTQLDMRQYDYFYFYNAFHENIDDSDRIDDRISYSFSLYEYYVRHLRNSLKTLPSGAKIVTYHTLWDEIPKEYRLMDTQEQGALNFWIKI